MRAFNGVIFRRINNQKDIEGFPFHLFSIIACGRGYVDPHCHLVIPHHQHDLNRCWQHLREKGHSRIGCILLEKNPLAELPEFYIGALLQAQLDVVKKDRIPFFLCKEHEPAALHKWIQRWQPQGIIGCVEYIHGWLSNYKNILSHRIDFTCLEKLNLKQQDIEGIDLRPQLMGKITIDQLDRAIRANERGLPKIRHTIHIESTWSANAASTHKS